MRINFPNGTLHGFFFMTFNATASAYEKQLNLTLVASNTTRYTISITSNRTTSGVIFNGTSDRTIITIYDIFPPVDNQWDVGLVIIFVVIQWIFVFLAYRFHEDHVMVKYAFFAIALAINSLLLGVGQRILAINGVSSVTFVNMIDSAEAIGLWITYIFTAYVFIFLLYTLTINVLTSGKELSTRLSRRNR
ncbi:hypothetical protein LCGC14_0534440 [marine sediment metagenome]|uniref:Uncharacterized protein n=1 Tax=marine sediment metagenome TaxID=412755 RepID=A0A0F9V2N6_9ZZZZ